MLGKVLLIILIMNVWKSLLNIRIVNAGQSLTLNVRQYHAYHPYYEC
jgi:hypothetical protein